MSPCNRPARPRRREEAAVPLFIPTGRHLASRRCSPGSGKTRVEQRCQPGESLLPSKAPSGVYRNAPAGSNRPRSPEKRPRPTPASAYTGTLEDTVATSLKRLFSTGRAPPPSVRSRLQARSSASAGSVPPRFRLTRSTAARSMAPALPGGKGRPPIAPPFLPARCTPGRWRPGTREAA